MTWEQGQDRTSLRRHVAEMAAAGGWERLETVTFRRGAQIVVLELEDNATQATPIVEFHTVAPADWNELVRRLR